MNRSQINIIAYLLASEEDAKNVAEVLGATIGRLTSLVGAEDAASLLDRMSETLKRDGVIT